jgi:hypothetical protein
MTLDDEIEDRQVRCQPHLVTLRLLTHRDAVTDAVGQVAEATGAILAEVKAAAGDGPGDPGTETLLEARLNRLASAAADAVAATVAGNLAEMRRQLDRFGTLTSALWTVQRAIYGPRRHAENPR